MRLKIRTWPAQALFLGLVLPAVADMPPYVQEASVAPMRAEAGKAFQLTVSGNTELCAPIFSGHTVSLPQDGALNLMVTAENNPLAKCVSGPHPYAAAFRIPALPEGSYPVFIALANPCLSAPQPCDVAIRPQFAGMLAIGPEESIAYAIDPARTAPGAEFSLSLLSSRFDCATSFDNLAVALDSNTITLTFLDHAGPETACPALYNAYGPLFKIPALKAGSYKVKAYRLPACHPCEMMGEVADAGVLTVGAGEPRKGWFLKENRAVPDKPFSLQLLNEAYGNCHTSFSHQNLEVKDGGIFTRFLVATRPELICAMDRRPHGPVFGMQGLNVGAYPVHATELMQCEVKEPFCSVLRLPPVPFDTLIVTQTVSVLISDLRTRGPKADMRGSRATLTLPAGGTGIWRAELVNTAGRLVSTGWVRASGGARAGIDFGTAPERGIYLMRLSGPDGKSHMAPIVRKD